jgi:hypothetical protein
VDVRFLRNFADMIDPQQFELRSQNIYSCILLPINVMQQQKFEMQNIMYHLRMKSQKFRATENTGYMV